MSDLCEEVAANISLARATRLLGSRVMEPRFFRAAADFRRWLERHHDRSRELWVGYYKKGSGKPSITWPESVDEALCFGWIDSVRRSVDDERYMNRFTPRRPGSTWSATNIKRARELIAEGRMRPAGLAAFEARDDERSAIYSYEQRDAVVLDPPFERAFRRNTKAWEFFSSARPSYRKAAIHWVMTAKRDETRRRRLDRLIDDSARGRAVPALTPRTPKR